MKRKYYFQIYLRTKGHGIGKYLNQSSWVTQQPAIPAGPHKKTNSHVLVDKGLILPLLSI
jgi:hypothetical protein